MSKSLVRFIGSIVVSLTILALLLQLLTSGLPEAQRPSIWEALSATAVWMLSGYFVLYLVQLYFRAQRYRLLLSLAGETSLPNLWQMAMVTGIRNMFVDMLPARVGELSYAALLNRAFGVKLEHCVSSLGIAIVFDFVALLIIAIGLVAKQLLGAEVEIWALSALSMIFLVTSLALVAVFYALPIVVYWLANKHFGFLQITWIATFLQWCERFAHSIEEVKRSKKLWQLTALSLCIRVLKYTGMYILFIAVAGPSFTMLAELPLEQIVGALVGGEVGASLPIPTFMSFGAYEAGSTLVFQLLGVANQAEAFVTMLCVHVWSQLMDYSFGGLFLLCFVWLYRQTNVIPKESNSAVLNIKQLSLYFLSGIALLGALAFLAYQVWAANKLGAISPPETGQSVIPEAGLAVADQSLPNGFVVFSSNRGGNHDIYRLELPALDLQRITQHPHTETYPRISPDGKKLVFARAHQPWVSQRNVQAWDVVVMNLSDLSEQVVGTSGTAPHWVNNQTISYVENAQRLVLVDITTGSKTVAFDVLRHPMMSANAQIYNARINPQTQQVTFTARQAHIPLATGAWGTALAGPSEVKGVLNGCELAWTSRYDGLFQVEPTSSNSAVRIVRIDQGSLTPSLLIDLEGEFNHEYWPKDSNDGQYVVFGASRGPEFHEHDTQDYEIFLWKQGDNPTRAHRLTYHTGNDNWPDVFIKPE